MKKHVYPARTLEEKLALEKENLEKLAEHWRSLGLPVELKYQRNGTRVILLVNNVLPHTDYSLREAFEYMVTYLAGYRDGIRKGKALAQAEKPPKGSTS